LIAQGEGPNISKVCRPLRIMLSMLEVGKGSKPNSETILQSQS